MLRMRETPFTTTHSLVCSVIECLVSHTVAWLRIFDRMETVLDSCDDAAGVVHSVVMNA